MERRYTSTAPARVKRDDGKQTITGYGSVFYDGTPDTEYELWSFGDERCVERVMPGAFSRALREGDDTRALFNHDPNCVLGRSSSGTLTMREDAKGLAYDIDPPDTQLARDLMVSIDRGDVSGSSFAFSIDDQTFRESRQPDGSTLVVREVNSVTLYDVSPVTYPAYEGATTGTRKEGDIEEARAAYRSWKQSQSHQPGPPLTARLAAIRARAVEVETGI